MKITLDKIITNKIQEIAEKKKVKGFLKAIKNPRAGDVSIIAEIKLVSPSVGRLGNEETGVRRAKKYESGGADAVSVVVDKKYFGGSYELLKRIKHTVNLPILAKDFIVDPFQIYEAKIIGASAILLIVKLVNKKTLRKFVALCQKIEIEPIVEINDEKDLEKAVATEASIIAVNARNLQTFTLDVDQACRLMEKIPDRFIKLGFSGIKSSNEVKKYQ
ncbi:indole-3-glycerol-phosphate synthase, partial [Candidatus Gottesmanbacteria bacterium]|nr:indole-3-glycerol-phosphate synthase [Candidatus Gottesmanbacteria bacterium]